jgi:hypothetical protein
MLVLSVSHSSPAEQRIWRPETPLQPRGRYYRGVIMQRTTIVIPPKLKQLAVERARDEGISFGEFVRHAVEEAIERHPRGQGKGRDTFLDGDRIFRGETPGDLSGHPDEYLHGERRSLWTAEHSSPAIWPRMPTTLKRCGSGPP